MVSRNNSHARTIYSRGKIIRVNSIFPGWGWGWFRVRVSPSLKLTLSLTLAITLTLTLALPLTLTLALTSAVSNESKNTSLPVESNF